jgi:hypothetical protein
MRAKMGLTPSNRSNICGRDNPGRGCLRALEPRRLQDRKIGGRGGKKRGSGSGVGGYGGKQQHRPALVYASEPLAARN